MKKIITIIGFTFLLFGCKQKLGSYYFDFDRVDWYNIDIDGNKLFNLEQQTDISKSQKLLIDLVINDKPDSKNDTLFINNLEKIGFKKWVIEEPEKLQLILEIFREKSHKESLAATCAAVYHDILIFRKNKRIEGIAKICFDCWKNQIHGTQTNTTNFGQSGDYQRLAKILRK